MWVKKTIKADANSGQTFQWEGVSLMLCNITIDGFDGEKFP
jgi:hypothetical protein